MAPTRYVESLLHPGDQQVSGQIQRKLSVNVIIWIIEVLTTTGYPPYAIASVAPVQLRGVGSILSYRLQELLKVLKKCVQPLKS